MKTYLLVVLLVVSFILIGCNHSYIIFAESVVQLNPACGPARSGFNVFISGSGFDPGASIRWNLIDSQGQIFLNGYYQTNDTGGFNDIAFLSDLKPDNYEMNFVQGRRY